jgi:hypothetical protein
MSATQHMLGFVDGDMKEVATAQGLMEAAVGGNGAAVEKLLQRSKAGNAFDQYNYAMMCRSMCWISINSAPSGLPKLPTRG